MSDETAQLVPAKVAYAGTWRIEPAETNETVTFSLSYPPSSSNSSGPIAVANLLQTPETLAGDRHPLRFELRREAGTFVCQGTANRGRGNGGFQFRPNPAYVNALREGGMSPLALGDDVLAGLFDVTAAFIKAIVAIGLPNVTFSQLLALKIFRIKSEDLSALHASFPSEGLDELRMLVMSGVTATYAEALRRADVTGLSAINVSALRASGVDRAFIESLAANGHRGLSIDDVASRHGDGC
jgi:hypothetical protein